MDPGLRDAFFRDPFDASEAAGIRRTESEANALTRIRPGAFAAFERDLQAKALDWRYGQREHSESRAHISGQ